MLNQIKLIGLLLLISSSDFLAQEYLLKVEQAVDSLEPKSGKNRKNYWHNYMGYGLIIGASEQGAATVPISSREFLYGARYKRKLSNTFAIGYDLLYKFQAYRLVQDSLKTLPSPLLNSRERMIFHHFSAAPYFRINFNPLRGNKLGRFIDLGAYGDFIFAHVLFQKNELSSGIITRTRSTRHEYFNRLNYGALLRLGSDRFSVYGAFRLSDIFFPSLGLPELSRITLGLQLNLN